MMFHVIICQLYVFFDEVFVPIFCLFYNGVFVIKFWQFFMYFGHRSFIKYDLQMFFPVCVLSFHSLNNVFHRAEVFNFDAIHYINLFFYGSGFGIISEKYLPSPRP